MCGITGIFNLNGEPVSAAILHGMTNSIAHRGPDGDGYYTNGPIGLGHRRLAIIDLSPAGKQPRADDNGELIISYNGEVYNFKELRAQLEHRGYCFNSQTDTEVILYAYKEWGDDCVLHFNGMFAFAIWDSPRQRLFLARDRYGIKPLYYYRDRNFFLFASEIKALLQHPAVTAEVNPSALLEYFTFQNIFADHTLFQNVKLLPAGHTATIEPGNPSSFQPRKYWDFDFREPSQAKDIREYEEELNRLFTQAVRRQLVSDVPVGSYLSGGMDSGAITAIAAQEMPYLATFTGGFDLTSVSGLELGYDERARAEALSYRFRTEHYEVVMKAGDMERVLANLVWHLEDLRVGQCYPNYFVARLASKFVKVVLSGSGGDELFAGYPWRYYRAVNNQSFEEYVQKYYKYWQRLVPNQVIHRLFQPQTWNLVKDTQTIDVFRGVIEHDRQDLRSPEEYVNRSLYFEIKTFLHGLFIVEDKLSMAHGLETRVPFLDNDLVDFAMQLPVSTKLRKLGEVAHIDENAPGMIKHLGRTNDGKQILRQVLGRYMPQEYVNGIKQGFSAPDATWFRGESIEYVKELLLDRDARIYEYLRPDTVSELVGEHISGQHNRRLLIWSLLCFEWWLRTFLAGSKAKL